MQEIKLPEDVADVVRRNGILAAFEMFPDSEEIQDMYSQQLLIHTQMREIMKDEASLQAIMMNFNGTLVKVVDKYTFYLNTFVISSFLFSVTYIFIGVVTLLYPFGLSSSVKIYKYSISSFVESSFKTPSTYLLTESISTIAGSSPPVNT